MKKLVGGLFIIVVGGVLFSYSYLTLNKDVDLDYSNNPAVDFKRSLIESSDRSGESAESSLIESEFVKVKRWGGYNTYEGLVKLSGAYVYSNNYTDYSLTMFCFDPDDQSREKLPEGSDFFCFDDIELTKKLFNTDSIAYLPPYSNNASSTECSIRGNALIWIRGFKVFVVETFGFDEADLVKVENNENAKLTCRKLW